MAGDEVAGESSTAGVEARGEDAVLSPYTGGGGGTVLGHRIATSYLADMLLGDGRPETDELPVVRIAFQTNPTDPVDDLRVEAERDGSRVVVHVAARRTPRFVKSHAKTAALVASLLDQLDALVDEDRAYVAVAVSGMTSGPKEVQLLASLARDNATEADFFAQVHTPGRHAGLARRYLNLTGLVRRARPDTPEDEMRPLVWSLLNRLWVLNFRVESDDETDWVHLANRLDHVARVGKSGADVRNELDSARATQFDSKGVVVDLASLRRRVHSVLEPAAGRSTAAWEQLAVEQESAGVAVRHTLAGELHLPRTQLQEKVQTALELAGATRQALLITGESGTGKSALTLSAATALAEATDTFQFVVMNLRRAPTTVAALSKDLGVPLTHVLREMSAPSRILVVDAADAAAEDRGPLLRELIAAARSAEAGIAVVSADSAVGDVSSALAGLYPSPVTFEVEGLSDDELRDVRQAVPSIAGALQDLPATSLYRRLAVVDLLSRTGVAVNGPLETWACLELIWTNLIAHTGGGSSAAARTATLLAMSETELRLPQDLRTYAAVDYAALDALRADLLVAPVNLRRIQPDFAHEEVRRFATAVRLVQAESITAVLSAAGTVRWSMSAAKLACQGKLSGADDPGAELASLAAQFEAFGDTSTVRWKDVPLEAALESPDAYGLLKHLLDADAARSGAVLDTLVRVVALYHQHDGLVDVGRGEPVVRLLLEETGEPWRRDDEKFRLLCGWLSSALLAGLPAGSSTRTRLRNLLLDHWRAHQPPPIDLGSAQKLEGEVVRNVFDGHSKRTRRRRTLGAEITQERYIQLLALLGPDIDEEVRACLHKVAAEVPSRLQSAVDSDWSAWGLASYEPGLLLELTEAYFVDTERTDGGRRWDGIRPHLPQGFRRLSGYQNGPFWVITLRCNPDDWIPVVNRILNHAANTRCRAEDGSGAVAPDARFTLGIDGSERVYVGDADVWGWYRGNTNGPYPCMSALQAVERWVDRAIAGGGSVEQTTTALLKGCENLAMPALVVGASVRHLDDPAVLDRFLTEPLIWQLEHSRAAHESLGMLRASDDGLKNAERRKWFLRDVAHLLVVHADERRRAELRGLAAKLVVNAARHGVSKSTVRMWAATLDSDNLTVEPVDGGALVSVREPEDIALKLAPLRAEMTRSNVLLGLQNKYWIPARQQKKEWAPPTAVEIAEDLALAKDLYDNPPAPPTSDPLLAVAHVAAAAVRSAAEGHPEAFGSHSAFALTSVLAILKQAAADVSDEEDALRFETDIGTREAAAGAVPHLLLPELARHLATAEVGRDDVAEAASMLGRLASTATCLSFARGCDMVWAHPCSGNPCFHETAYQWSLDLGRLCELGESDDDYESYSRPLITDNLLVRVPNIDPDRLDTSRLSATIRALGRAASSISCVADEAERGLSTLLHAQARAMAALESSEHLYFVDDDGGETMAAARALLHSQARTGTINPLLMEYATVLVPTPHVFSAFLRDLAAAGAETQELGDAAKRVWPALLEHVLGQVESNSVTYDKADSFVGYALGHLLPVPDTDVRHNELGRSSVEWVEHGDLVRWIPRWLGYAAGRHACLFELIRFLRQLPVETQLREGFNWLESLCLSHPERQLVTYEPMNEWLVEIKPQADARGAGTLWLNLVDRLVYAGNERLAKYSR